MPRLERRCGPATGRDVGELLRNKPPITAGNGDTESSPGPPGSPDLMGTSLATCSARSLKPGGLIRPGR